MPESGGLPRRSRSNDSLDPTRISGSGRMVRDDSSAHRQSPRASQQSDFRSSGMRDASAAPNGSASRQTRRQRLSFWQVLFGRGSQKTSRRSAAQAKRKDLNATSVHPPHALLQRLNQGSQRSSSEQTASKLADKQVRQAVLGRSRQFSGSTSAANTNAVKRKGKVSPRQETSYRSGSSQSFPLSSGASTIPAFQSRSQLDGREQANALTLKREARQRTRPGGTSKRSYGPGVDRTSATDFKFSGAQAHKQEPTRPRSRSFSAGLYAARMLILSVGIGVLAGTMLSMVDPGSRLSAGASQQATKKTAAVEMAQANPGAATAQGTPSIESTSLDASAVQLPKTGQELAILKADLQALALKMPQLTPGIFLYELDSSAYLDLNGGASFAAASTIKVPILIAFFQDVDAGKIRLDELLTMRKELVAGGSGEMQGLPVGTQFTALETVTKMITISDNTATNMVIARLGGMSALDQRFRSWGLVSTAINSLLPDLSGTNTTSPRDMALLMTRISQGELVSIRSRDRVLDIMQRTVNRSQLPQGLGKGATIAHKTGDIGGMIGDVGLIDMPSGKRYALTVLVKRSFNDDSAYDLVQKASRTVYQYLNRAPADQNRPTTSRPLAPGQSSPQAGTDPAHSGALIMPTETAITQSPSLDTATR
ncbi:serine hydrolase [Stenomitos frigidus]|uniref:Serine hydrolase n=1 Tax=Stenomitos frigidus ULC18 TaxID=2107698 RepID=A0A2T1DYC0_9CYAN|nr:serine hydrolase [Stenomitos frigidus]PSB25488.1 serine hydrolase [Stenomitos frigidus ULC18]